jgi:crossover junction endodeoxyribonuclease RuvC
LRILAIDPGSRHAGFAVIEGVGSRPHYIASGVLSFSLEDDFFQRLKNIFNDTLTLVKTYNPDVVALESLIYVKSPTALIKLAQARGAMISALTQCSAQFYEYSPNLIKSTVTGHGHADKENMQKWIYLQLGISEFKTHDESDALAIALCHWYHNQKNSTLGMKIPQKKRKGRSLQDSLRHRLKEMN